MAKIENVTLVDARNRQLSTPITGGAALKTLNVDLNGNVQGKPDLIDITNDPVFYEGYKYLDTYKICKIDATTGVIARTWAEGAWANRVTLLA